MNVAVVGSGLSGFAVIRALVARGLAVTVIDVGEALEQRREAVVAKLSTLPPAQWPANEFNLIDENPTLGRHALPKRVHYGSEYIYANDRSFAPIVSGAGTRLPYPTFAKGGYSNIWGAAVLGADGCDMADWPISHSELVPYFREIARLIPITGGEGTLQTTFPTYTERVGQIDPGPQGRALLKDMQQVAPRLAARQLLYGRARLAVYTEPGPGSLPCISCGHCFTGCVYGSVFSTVPMLQELIEAGQISYRSGQFVESVNEEDAQARLEITEVASGARRTERFDAVFLAGGPLNTTRLLLKSRRHYDVPVLLKESQKFVLPMLRRRGAQTAIERPSPSLASLFIEAKVPELSDHWMHVQVVPMNDLIAKGAPIPGIRTHLGQRLLRPLLRRMMAAWCGMHSDHSAGLELRLRAPDATSKTALEINLKHSEKARADARIAAKHLFREGLSFGTLFVYQQMKFSEPGSGTHCGSSFPMTARPSAERDTDVLGRPFGWSRVFAVDASVLPSIPGTTLAFSVMANAYRIGTLAPVGELTTISDGGAA